MKKVYSLLIAMVFIPMALAAADGWPANYGGVMLQGFYWDSYQDTKWSKLTSQADELSKYFDLIWVPNSAYCASYSSMGYDPCYWFDQRSAFGNESTLRTMIETFKKKGTGFIEDIVINHKKGAASKTDFPEEKWNGNTISWSLADFCSNDDGGYSVSQGYKFSGAYDSGDDFSGYPDIDHTSANVQKNVKLYFDYLLNDLGYVGFRLDMVKGYSPQYTKLYNQAANPKFSVGEYWDGSYEAVTGWINNTGKTSAAFDFPLKFKLNEACSGNWGALSDKGIAGSPDMNRYAVTFIDNHDTWRKEDGSAPNRIYDNVLAANAFILGMPGTPCIFLPHWKSYKTDIANMILARKAAGITNQSTIEQQDAVGGGYVIKVRGTKGTVLVTVGPVSGYDTSGFKLISSGDNYAYYVTSSTTVSGLITEKNKEFTVYVNATEEPYLYAWNSHGTLNGAWPGKKMTETTTTEDGKTWFKQTFKAPVTNIIITDNEGNQTDDIPGIDTDTYLTYDGKETASDVTYVYDGSADASGLPSCATVKPGHVYAYFEADGEYPNPSAYAWNGATQFAGSWPGTKMEVVGKTKEGNTVYLWDGGKGDDLPAMIIFNNTSSPQTQDLVFINGGYYNSNGYVATVSLPDNIQSMKAETTTHHNYYDLQGRNMGTTLPTTKGIYIYKGGKFVVK